MGVIKTGLIMVATAFVLLAILGMFAGEHDPDAPLSAAQRAAYARENCREFIRRQLHDPGRAEWEDPFDWPVAVQASGALEVIATLRAPNAFGGMVRATYICLVIQSGRASRLVELRQL